jgi:peroxiredoxin
MLQGQKAVVFGVPDAGKVCSEKHVPGYLKEVDKLRQLGITKVVCLTVNEAAAAKEWASKLKLDASKVGSMR